MRVRFQFPQLSRVFPAGLWILGKGMLMIFFLAVIVYNIWEDPFRIQTVEKRLQQAVLIAPFSSSAHQALAQYYAQRNRAAAQQEYALVAEIEGNGAHAQVLGSSMVDQAILHSRYASQKTLWERIHQAIPDYRYAVAQLSLLSWMLGDKTESQRYLETLIDQNPVDPLIPHLREQIK